MKQFIYREIQDNHTLTHTHTLEHFEKAWWRTQKYSVAVIKLNLEDCDILNGKNIQLEL